TRSPPESGEEGPPKCGTLLRESLYILSADAPAPSGGRRDRQRALLPLDAVAPLRLGAVERLVGALEQVPHVVAVRRLRRRHAPAERDRVRGRARAQPLGDARRDGRRRLRGGVAQEQRELLAPDAEGVVFCAQAALQELADVHQHLVARGVAELVVD